MTPLTKYSQSKNITGKGKKFVIGRDEGWWGGWRMVRRMRDGFTVNRRLGGRGTVPYLNGVGSSIHLCEQNGESWKHPPCQFQLLGFDSVPVLHRMSLMWDPGEGYTGLLPTAFANACDSRLISKLKKFFFNAIWIKDCEVWCTWLEINLNALNNAFFLSFSNTTKEEIKSNSTWCYFINTWCFVLCIFCLLFPFRYF